MRAGDVVSRDELRQQLWPDDTFVEFDHSLNTAVKRLREALGDDASTPRHIETIRARGYRFVAPVERASGAGLRDAEQPPEQPSAPRGAASAARAGRVPANTRRDWPDGRAAIAAVIVLVVWQRPSPPDAAAVEPRRLRLAVLPFTNLTGDPDRQLRSRGTDRGDRLSARTPRAGAARGDCAIIDDVA